MVIGIDGMASFISALEWYPSNISMMNSYSGSKYSSAVPMDGYESIYAINTNGK
jgi:hypothetical protein